MMKRTPIMKISSNIASRPNEEKMVVHSSSCHKDMQEKSYLTGHGVII